MGGFTLLYSRVLVYLLSGRCVCDKEPDGDRRNEAIFVCEFEIEIEIEGEDAVL